jgi:valyl-tRNA synthetase
MHADDLAEIDMRVLQELIGTVRTLRKDLGIEEKVAVPMQLSRYSIPADCLSFVRRLARISEVIPVDSLTEGASSRSTFNFDVAVVYERKIDVAAERERLVKELTRFEKEASNAERQLANHSFLAKAPSTVVEGLRRRAGELSMLIPKTRAALDSLGPQK